MKMRRAWLLLAVCSLLPLAVRAQIGRSVSVPAGSPEDTALSAIYAATDPAQKIALLDQFNADFGKGDLALLADQLYVGAYLEMKNYDKALEFGEKALALDPDNLPSAVGMVHAAEGKGDAAKLFDSGEHVVAILARYKDAPAPADTPPDQWQQQKDENLKNAQSDVGYVQYALFNGAYRNTVPATRATLLERYLKDFPDSPYAANAREALPFAYQQAQNYPKMLDAAQSLLASDPNNAGMLVLLSDYWSDKGQQLDKAEQYAKKALDLLAQAKKPEGVTDEQWQQQISLQKGYAYSALGQIYVTRDRNDQAVASFKQASPLLKSDAFSYGRNLYRLGFTLAKMQRIPEARTILTEALGVNSPYKVLAQQTLDKIGGRVSRRTHK
jgi:tetratricopeptide (TPR) repeat protein